MRNALIVLENSRKIAEQEGSDEDIRDYVMSEGYTAGQLNNIPIPKNLTNIATMLSVAEKAGKVLTNTPGILGELARNPKIVSEHAPLVGQVLGGIAGFAATKTPAGSKIGASIGATTGETLSQAIKLVRGEQVSPKDALKEVLQTGAIATASEAAFGMGSPGAKLMGDAFSKIATKYGKPSIEAMEKTASKIFQATSGQISPEDSMALMQKGAKNILTDENMGNSISPKIITKATKGLDLIKKNAQKAYAEIVRPLESNQNLVTNIKPIVDDFQTIVKEFGLVDKSGNIKTGLLEKTKSGKEVLGILNKFKFVERAKGKGFVLRDLRENVTFEKLLATQRELDDVINFSSQPMAVNPVSTKVKGALKAFRGRVSQELETIGGEGFAAANDAYSEAMRLFGDLQKVLKTDEIAERTLETVLKNSRQMRLFKLQDLNAKLPKNLQFIGDLENFALAQKFKREGFNLMRAGIIGGILTGGGLASGGPIGGLAGLTAAYYGTTPKGVGMTISGAQKLGGLVASKSSVIQETAKRTLAPLIASKLRGAKQNRQ